VRGAAVLAQHHLLGSALAEATPASAAGAQGAGAPQAAAAGAPSGLNKACIDKLQATFKDLSKVLLACVRAHCLLNVSPSQKRKNRAVPADLTLPAGVSDFVELSSHTLHKSSAPGVLSLDISLQNPDIVRPSLLQ